LSTYQEGTPLFIPSERSKPRFVRLAESKDLLLFFYEFRTHLTSKSGPWAWSALVRMSLLKADGLM